MRITQLSLTNFKSFKQTQTIKFAPVTLLFGPNSVGKSTVLMALAYLQQILQKGQCNPQRLDVLGGKFVGGFKNLVHGRDLNKSIKLAVEFDKQKYIGQTYNEVMDLLAYELNFHHNSPSEFQTAKLEFEISWSKPLNTAYVSAYKVWLDGLFIAALNSDSGLKQPIIENLNYLHPLLIPENHDDWLEEQFDDGDKVHSALEAKSLELKGYEKQHWREVAKGADFIEDPEEWPDFTDYCFVSHLHKLLNDNRLISKQMDDTFIVKSCNAKYWHVPIGFEGHSGALPNTGKVLKTPIDLDDDPYTAMVHEVLSDIVVSPLDDLLIFLEKSLSIGPLRNIPDATFQANPYPKQSDWHNGIAAWDVLAQADVELLRKVDSWISSQEHLNLGYGIALKVEKQFAEFKKISTIDGHDKVEKQLESMIFEDTFQKETKFRFDEKNTHYEYALWDADNHIDVRPSDVGVGVSQLMPLVVAALSRDSGLVAVEQPELHVHPRIQVAIGDLLTQLENPASFLIETHSEHLILRILKRIRESSAKTLPAGLSNVSPGDISVVCFKSSEDGVRVNKLPVTEDGDFSERWPGGFFDERDEELF
ncbi:hypothetical protein N480_09775 [Pseudoalteromonas luteoviolacea S2607]|uniref:AAA family ATPase n=1 Tax=Pseudoalteromonas luteoviolacea TaxID=43657 RepID=UPI0007B04919|nr:AAA family ATPase [Pseudoalteromonas luteoviolacea]KZN29047.1 hypothetical protein N480_09775 [Pseudoalteromonas luteoviolacea S2607]